MVLHQTGGSDNKNFKWPLPKLKTIGFQRTKRFAKKCENFCIFAFSISRISHFFWETDWREILRKKRKYSHFSRARKCENETIFPFRGNPSWGTLSSLFKWIKELENPNLCFCWAVTIFVCLPIYYVKLRKSTFLILKKVKMKL